MKFEIRDVDAWGNREDGFTWNASYKTGEFTTIGDGKRAFLRALHKLGVSCKRGKCVVCFDGDIYELRDRKTGEPLFAAIPMN